MVDESMLEECFAKKTPQFWYPSWNCYTFFKSRHVAMVWHAQECFHLIPSLRKCRTRHRNHDPTWTRTRDIGDCRFRGGHFEKWPPQVVSPSFFSGNIAILTPIGPLKTTIPPTEDHGGGAWGPLLAHGLHVLNDPTSKIINVACIIYF